VLYLIFSRNLPGGGLRGSRGESPLDILKRRYAEGEIPKEEFNRMKREIKGKK
jgi:putative membrane protein